MVKHQLGHVFRMSITVFLRKTLPLGNRCPDRLFGKKLAEADVFNSC